MEFIPQLFPFSFVVRSVFGAQKYVLNIPCFLHHCMVSPCEFFITLLITDLSTGLVRGFPNVTDIVFLKGGTRFCY